MEAHSMKIPLYCTPPQHKDEDHEFWSYLFFINYLHKKDPTERTGVESFVSSKLEQEGRLKRTR